MKFITVMMFDADKAANVAAVGDKIANLPGAKVLAQYVCQGMLFSGIPPNTMVALVITEAESNEALAARNYPMVLAGASVWNVPVIEMAVGGITEVEKKFRG